MALTLREQLVIGGVKEIYLPSEQMTNIERAIKRGLDTALVERNRKLGRPLIFVETLDYDAEAERVAEVEAMAALYAKAEAEKV